MRRLYPAVAAVLVVLLAGALVACLESTGPSFPDPDEPEQPDSTDQPGVAFRVRAVLPPAASLAPFQPVDHDRPLHVAVADAGKVSLSGGTGHVLEPRGHLRAQPS